MNQDIRRSLVITAGVTGARVLGSTAASADELPSSTLSVPDAADPVGDAVEGLAADVPDLGTGAVDDVRPVVHTAAQRAVPVAGKAVVQVQVQVHAGAPTHGVAGAVQPFAAGLHGEAVPFAHGVTGQAVPFPQGAVGRVPAFARGIAEPVVDLVQPVARSAGTPAYGVGGDVRPFAAGAVGEVGPFADGVTARAAPLAENLNGAVPPTGNAATGVRGVADPVTPGCLHPDV
ncbi:hypothetical protein [Streptomyces sp. TRM68416]|uniref:hypothetical protein n=1 Tax=Streptomyces sp. TRM68416 TaxID=2758412 RepID=UPI001661F8F5|nr:hypothetical protein [Streptomyces sp. TRM68416]MBD0839212.1 hypothetical protein [Streptomyces sp. TRM68416]